MPSIPSDPDPLLAFSEEAGNAPAAAVNPSPVPEAPAAVAHTAPPPAVRDVNPAIEALTSRVARLERAVDDAKSVCAQLRSEVETLVRARADNAKQPSRRPIVVTRPVMKSPARASWTASAIVAVVIGVIAALAGWRYLPGHAGASIVESVAPQPAGAETTAAEPVADPSPAEPDATSHEPLASAAPAAPAAPHVALVALKTPQASASARAQSGELRRQYVGTLSVDADPGGDVSIDRRGAGKTPLRIANLKAGSHLVWVERNGYRRWTRVVNVPADRVSRVFADLEPIASR